MQIQQKELQRNWLLETQINIITIDDINRHTISNSICAICRGEFQIGEKCEILICKHNYHHECIGDWLSNPGRSRCPYCNRTIYSRFADPVAFIILSYFLSKSKQNQKH